MADTVFSHSGDTLGISTAAANSDLDQSGFEALTFTAIGKIGNLGEYGTNTNPLQYDTWNTSVALKAKGVSNAGDPQLEVAADLTDAGQQALNTAGAPSYTDNHGFEHVKQSGDTFYLRGLVSGPNYPNGGNEDFDLAVYTLMLNQIPLPVAA